LNANNHKILSLSEPKEVAEIEASQKLAAIQITFTDAVDHGSIRAGGFNEDPRTFSLLVQGSWSNQLERFVPGTVTPQSSIVTRFSIDPEFSTFRRGKHTLTLFGQKDPAGRRPVVAGMNGLRLDGEPTKFPTGDDVEGGDFVINFNVT
jgi:hypothetical protein